MEIIEGILGFLMFIVIVGAFFGGFQWIMAKFFGVRYHGKFQARQAMYQSLQEKDELRHLSNSNPKLVEEAINRCKKKHYKLTPPNILSEAAKIEKENSGIPSTKEKIKQSVKSIAQKLKSQNSTKVEKIDKLNELKQQGVINEEEFEQLKSEIINPF